MSIQQTRLLQAELIERNSPEIKPPLPILPDRTHFKVAISLIKSQGYKLYIYQCRFGSDIP